jgi:single-stranded DNA-binding protein
MNDLNSILLEGTLAQDPVLSHDEKGVPRCLFSITSDRYLKRDNDIKKQTIGIPIHTEGKMAEQCANTCRQGRKIRVVGCLDRLTGINGKGREAAQLVIRAEHFELKPELSVKREKESSLDGFSR